MQKGQISFLSPANISSYATPSHDSYSSGNLDADLLLDTFSSCIRDPCSVTFSAHRVTVGYQGERDIRCRASLFLQLYTVQGPNCAHNATFI